MKKLHNYILILFSFLAIQGCKEDTLTTYLDNEGGENIYFLEKYNNYRYESFMKEISLGLTPSTVTDSLILIPIRTTGQPSQTDRPVLVVPADTSSMKKGVHYDFVSEPKIRAGRVTDTISIILHRTEDIKVNRVFLKLDLKPNDHFKTDLAIKKNLTKQDLLSYQFYLDDKFPVPHIWTTFFGKQLVEFYLGTYSRRKVELMLEVLKIEPRLIYDTKYTLPVTSILNWSSYLKYWLNKEKNEGRTQYDENGVEIFMGPFAN